MDLTAERAPAADRLGARLETALGHAAVAEPATERAIDGRVPRLVVAPGSEEEVAAALRILVEEGAATVVWGGGTRVGVGAPPARYDVALSLERLGRVVRHDPADLTATVEAGCTGAALDAALAASGQRLEADIPFASRATIGGTLASGAAGAREGDLGSLRNLVIGSVAVTADGRVTRSGGRVVKNVTGYDLHRLYARSFGTLVVLTQLHLRLAPRPARRLLVAARYARAAAVAHAADRARLAPIRPTGIAVASARVARTALGEDVAAAGGWWLVLGWEGAAEDVEAAHAASSAVWEPAGDMRRVEGAEVDAIWQRIADRTSGDALGRPDAPSGREDARGGGDGSGALERSDEPPQPLRAVVALPPAAAAGFIASLGDGTREPHVLWIATRGRIVLHGSARPHLGWSQTPFSAMREDATAAGGWLVAERMPAAWKTPDHVWGPPPPHQPLLARVKRALDPTGVLAPGRLAGGL